MSGCDSIRKAFQRYLDSGSGADIPDDIIRHWEECSACRGYCKQLERVSELLGGAGEVLGREEVDLWSRIRPCLKKEEGRGRQIPFPFFRRLRPVWIGAAVSAAAALILFFSGVFGPEGLPSNYCRIESISAPENNLMIYQDREDGLTIIWLME